MLAHLTANDVGIGRWLRVGSGCQLYGGSPKTLSVSMEAGQAGLRRVNPAFIALDQLFSGEDLKPALPSHLRSGSSMRLATFAQEIPQGSATGLGLFAPHIVSRIAHCYPLAFWVARSYGGDAPLQ